MAHSNSVTKLHMDMADAVRFYSVVDKILIVNNPILMVVVWNDNNNYYKSMNTNNFVR
jgi:hypothetical protein